jgi:hypothetical protein
MSESVASSERGSARETLKSVVGRRLIAVPFIVDERYVTTTPTMRASVVIGVVVTIFRDERPARPLDSANHF